MRRRIPFIASLLCLLMLLSLLPAAVFAEDGEIDIVEEITDDTLISEEELAALVADVMEGYPAYLADNGITEETPYAHLPDYLQSPAVRDKLSAAADRIEDVAAELSFTEDDGRRILSDLTEAYRQYAEQNELPDPALLVPSFEKYMGTEQARALIGRSVTDALGSPRDDG